MLKRRSDECEVGSEAPACADVVGQAYRAACRKLGRLGFSLKDFRARVREILDDHPQLNGRAESLALEDLYLAMGCQLGNEKAWRIFDASFRGYLRRLCIRATGNEHDGEELLGDLYADLVSRPKARGRIELYRGLAGLGTWLGVIIRRMSLDRLRLRERRLQREKSFELDERGPAQPVSTPEARLLQEESVEVGRQILQQALAELEPHHRLVLRLVYWDGLTLREAGHVMGLDFTTVSRRLKNARLALHSLLKRVSRRGFDLPAEALPDVLLPAGGSGNGVAQEPPLDGES